MAPVGCGLFHQMLVGQELCLSHYFLGISKGTDDLTDREFFLFLSSGRDVIEQKEEGADPS